MDGRTDGQNCYINVVMLTHDKSDGEPFNHSTDGMWIQTLLEAYLLSITHCVSKNDPLYKAL